MKIVLEGCDGTGKTTLAKLLADKYHLDICHCTSKDPADYEFYRQTTRKENVIWDRHVLGELVYPDVFHRRPKIGVEDAKLVTWYARDNGVRFFILTSDIETIKKRIMARGNEDQRIVDKIEWINQEFMLIAQIFNIPVIDTSKMTIEEIFELVEKDQSETFAH